MTAPTEVRNDDATAALDRLALYQAFADIGRKWSPIMDAKAGFLSALNAAVLAFIWTGAKLADQHGWPHFFALSSTALSVTSLLLALNVVVPRVTLAQAFKKKTEYLDRYKPVSFFNFVATEYDTVDALAKAITAMSQSDFEEEALEQHLTISHIVRRKSAGVTLSGHVCAMAIVFALVALVVK